MKITTFPQGLQITDVELDERVTALEENGGGGSSSTGKDLMIFRLRITQPNDGTVLTDSGYNWINELIATFSRLIFE